MTASPGREVDANLLRGAALGSAQPRAGPDDAGRQDLGDLLEALGGGHQVRIKGLGHWPKHRRQLSLRSHAHYIPARLDDCRVAPIQVFVTELSSNDHIVVQKLENPQKGEVDVCA